MTSDEAEAFYEDDEDPAEIFAKLDAAIAAGTAGYTISPPQTSVVRQHMESPTYHATPGAMVAGRGLYGHLGVFTASASGQTNHGRESAQE